MTRKLRTFVLVAALGYAGCPAAYAAGAFDGNWSGTGEAKGECGVLSVAMIVKDNKISGSIKGAKGTAAISSGTVETDGSAKIKYQNSGATVKFSKDTFVGNFATLCGVREATGKKG